MSVVKLNGIDVQFPFEPYPLQRAYMSQVIRSAKNKMNALLESPTGTGKTLSMLCASLAWLNSEIKLKKSKLASDVAGKLDLDGDFFSDSNLKKNTEKSAEEDEGVELMPKIYFSSRTHSQLSQSIKELKKANYDNNTAVVLAGRDVLCLNEDVRKLDNIGAKNQACKSKIGANCSCKYYKDVETKITATRDYYDNPVLDVEDLLKYGEKHSICPYFASRVIQKKSQVVFLPYNYLLDPKIRKAQRIQFNDDIIIFDEGHNIEKTCEDSISVDLRSDSLAVCIREMQTIYQFYQQSIENQLMLDAATLDAVKEFTTEDLLTLKQILDDFEIQVDEKVSSFTKHGKNKGDVCELDWIFQLMSKCNLSFDNTRKIAEICDKIQAFLTCILPVKGPAAMTASSSLNSFKDFISVLFPDESENIASYKKIFQQKFRVYLEVMDEEDSKPRTNVSHTSSTKGFQKSGPITSWLQTAAPEKQVIRKWVLHIWCLSPSVGLKSLIKSNVRSILLTSGTLAPLESFEAEFDTKFECKIQNPHIIKRTQMAVYPVAEAYSNVKLDSTYSNKDNINYYKALGDTLVDICNNVPDGILVFFQSYSVMFNSIKKWKDNDHQWKIWFKLSKLKPVFQEVKDKEEFNQEIVRYRESVYSGRGGSFFAICRGKLSEGIDLGDRLSRAVVLIGLPYPSTQDPRVKMKKSYLETTKHPNFTANNWYSLQMKRALNQAIGRAIRHKSDYGCVFLLDYRFENQTQDLSKWCRDFVKTPSTYRDMMIEVKMFFENNKADDANRKKAIKSETVPTKGIDDTTGRDENKDLELDFSLSEYLGKKKARKSKKRTIYESSLDENSKKAKNSLSKTSQKATNVFDLFEPANNEETKSNSNQKRSERKHIEIEFDCDNQGKSKSNPVLVDNRNASDSIILLSED